jgi:hypothetical protein
VKPGWKTSQVYFLPNLPQRLTFAATRYKKTNSMDTQAPYTNHWKHYHDSLTGPLAQQCKERIEYVLNISQSAFYRKLRQPNKFLSIAEKEAIGKVYNLKAEYLFPELEE